MVVFIKCAVCSYIVAPRVNFSEEITKYFELELERRKLKWHGHVTRLSELAKTILQGTVQEGRRRRRRRKRWEDNIREWTGLEWNIILREAENHEEWRKLVVESPVVPSSGQPDYGIGEGEGW